MEHELMEIERTMWTNDPAVYEAGYLPDAVLIFPGVGRIGTATAVAAIREENRRGRAWAEVHFEDVLARSVGEGVTVVTYRARARWNDEDQPSSTLCSTLYVRTDDGWRIALHQQTLA
jgi:hypothetical protein